MKQIVALENGKLINRFKNLSSGKRWMKQFSTTCVYPNAKLAIFTDTGITLIA